MGMGKSGSDGIWWWLASYGKEWRKEGIGLSQIAHWISEQRKKTKKKKKKKLSQQYIYAIAAAAAAHGRLLCSWVVVVSVLLCVCAFLSQKNDHVWMNEWMNRCWSLVVWGLGFFSLFWFFFFSPSESKNRRFQLFQKKTLSLLERESANNRRLSVVDSNNHPTRV
jgi:hypothetical protein